MGLNLEAYPIIKEAQDSTSMIRMTDLVAIGNIDKQNGDIVTTVVSDSGSFITVNKLHSDSFVGRYVVVGREICKITSITRLTTTSNIYLERGLFGTLDSYENRLLDDCAILPYYSFRTVTLFDNVNSFSTNSLNLNTSDIFGLNLETGSVEIDVENFIDWDVTNTQGKYWFKSRGTTIYIFRGLNGQRSLFYTGFGQNMNENRSRSESKLTISFNDKFALWFNKDMDVVAEFNNAYPKTFFSTLLGIDSSMVLYDNGLQEIDYKTVNRVYSKEFKTYKDLLIQYAQHGNRMYFDELERLHVAQEFYPSKLTVTHEIPLNETNIIDIKRSSDNRLIRNKITTTYKDRQPMYDYENTLQGKAKLFRYNLPITNFTVLAGNDEFNVLTVSSSDLMSKTLVGDYVLLEDDLLGIQFYGKVLNKDNITTEILLGRFQKDFKTLPFGKYAYLTSLGYDLPRNFTLNYSIAELPVVAELTINYESGERAESLLYPLLPQVVGQDENNKNWNMTLGSVDDLDLGSYSGFTTNIEGCYGTWDNTKLFYDREKTQFDGENPPIYVLSNKIVNARGNEETSILGFDTYDNSNLQMTVSKPTDDSDMAWTFKNTISIPSSSLVSIQPITRMSDILLKIDNPTGWNVGDVLMVQPLPNMSITDRNTYSQVKNIRYIVEAFITEGTDEYVIVSDVYPRASTAGVVFPCIKYPFNSIVYLQEAFIRGNPIIELEQSITQTNQTSIDYYDTTEYPLTGIFYHSDDLKDFIDYILKGYSAIRSDGLDRKISLPIQVRDNYHVQKGDIIRVKDTLITGIQPTQLYYVLGVQHSSRNPIPTLNVVNLNVEDADGSYMDFDSKLTYTPVIETYYAYNGATGTDVGKKTVQDVDDDFGQMQINRVDRSDFRANILSVVDNKITFDTFEGNDITKYRDLFFGKLEKSEFVVMLNNEYVYLKSYDDLNELTDSAMIIKRGLFSSALSDLNQPQTVTFYTIASGVSTDGKLVSHDLYVGTDTDHLKFNPLLGLEVKSKGEIDLSNDNNRVYLDPSNVDNKSQILIDVGTIVGKEDVEFQVGDTSNINGYLKYTTENGLELNAEDLKLKGENVANNIIAKTKNLQFTKSLTYGDSNHCSDFDDLHFIRTKVSSLYPNTIYIEKIRRDFAGTSIPTIVSITDFLYNFNWARSKVYNGFIYTMTNRTLISTGLPKTVIYKTDILNLSVSSVIYELPILSEISGVAQSQFDIFLHSDNIYIDYRYGTSIRRYISVDILSYAPTVLFEYTYDVYVSYSRPFIFNSLSVIVKSDANNNNIKIYNISNTTTPTYSINSFYDVTNGRLTIVEDRVIIVGQYSTATIVYSMNPYNPIEDEYKILLYLDYQDGALDFVGISSGKARVFSSYSEILYDFTDIFNDKKVFYYSEDIFSFFDMSIGYLYQSQVIDTTYQIVSAVGYSIGVRFV